jgi:hypothetical protein
VCLVNAAVQETPQKEVSNSHLWKSWRPVNVGDTVRLSISVNVMIVRYCGHKNMKYFELSLVILDQILGTVHHNWLLFHI